MNRAFRWLSIVLLASTAAAYGQSSKRQVVVLDDGTVLEGVVQSIDKIVRVTPAAGPARIVTAAQVSFLGASREDAYDYVAKIVDTNTADGARKLATWCEKAGLPEKALVHARALAALAPTDTAVRDWIAKLEKARSKKLVETKASKAPDTLPVELASGSAVAYAARIQPILTNQCAGCHAATAYAGTFKLGRIAEGYANPDVAAANLKVVAAHLRSDDPAKSAVLIYALTAHGGQKRPAFANREAAAFRHLEAWTIESLPPRREAKGFVATTGFVAKSEPKRESAEPVSALPGAVVGELGRPAVAVNRPVVVHPSPIPRAADPFDPAEFNRRPQSRKK